LAWPYTPGLSSRIMDAFFLFLQRVTVCQRPGCTGISLCSLATPPPSLKRNSGWPNLRPNATKSLLPWSSWPLNRIRPSFSGRKDIWK
jgi:hypothetical protein